MSQSLNSKPYTHPERSTPDGFVKELKYEIEIPPPPPSTQVEIPKELKYETSFLENYFPPASSEQISHYPGLQTNRNIPSGTTADAKKNPMKLAKHLDEHLKELLNIDFGSVVKQLTPEQISYLRESSKINTMQKGYDNLDVALLV